MILYFKPLFCIFFGQILFERFSAEQSVRHYSIRLSREERSCTKCEKISRNSRSVPEMPLVEFSLVFFGPHYGVGDDFPFLGGIDLKGETAFKIGLIETRHESMGIMTFELSV
jgi:hypothetical protein